MRVTVKTLDGIDHPFDVDGEMTIAAFKQKIFENINVTVETQRIIFQGRILQDASTLEQCGIADRVVHLVTRPPPSVSNAGGIATSSSGTSTGPSDGMTGIQPPTHPGLQHPMFGLMNTMRTLVQSNLTHLLPPGQRPNIRTHTSGNHVHMDVVLPPTALSTSGDTNREHTDSETAPDIDHGGAAEPEATQQRVSMARLRRRYVQRVLQDRLLPLIRRMDDLNPLTEPSTSETTAESEPVLMEAEPSTEPSEVPPSSAPPDEASRPGRTLDPELSQPLTIDALADIMVDIEAMWGRIAVHLPRWRNLLREWANLVPNEEQTQRLERDLNFYDSVSGALHLYSHLLHNVSDFMIDLALPSPHHLMVLSGVTHQEILEASIHLEASEIPHPTETTDTSSTPANTGTTDTGNGDLGSRLRRMNVHNGTFGDVTVTSGGNNTMPPVISGATGGFTVPIMLPGGFGVPLATLLGEGQHSHIHPQTATNNAATTAGSAGPTHIHIHTTPTLATDDIAGHEDLQSVSRLTGSNGETLQGGFSDPYLPCDSRHFLPPDVLIRSRQAQTASGNTSEHTVNLPQTTDSSDGQDAAAAASTDSQTHPQSPTPNSASVQIEIIYEYDDYISNIPFVAAIGGAGNLPFQNWMQRPPAPVNVAPGMPIPPRGAGGIHFLHRGGRMPRGVPMPPFRPEILPVFSNLLGPTTANNPSAEDMRMLSAQGREVLDRVIQSWLQNSTSDGAASRLLVPTASREGPESSVWRDFLHQIVTGTRPELNLVQFSRLMESWLHRLAERVQGQGFEHEYAGGVPLSSFLPTAPLLRGFDATRSALYAWMEAQRHATLVECGAQFMSAEPPAQLRFTAMRLALHWIATVERHWLMALPRSLARLWIRPLAALCMNHIQALLEMFTPFRTDFGFGPVLCTRLLRWQLNMCHLFRTLLTLPGVEEALNQHVQEPHQLWATYLRNLRAHGPRSIFQRLNENQDQLFAYFLHCRWSCALQMATNADNPIINAGWALSFFLYHSIEFGINNTSQGGEAGVTIGNAHLRAVQARNALHTFFSTWSSQGGGHTRRDSTPARETIFQDMLLNLNERELVGGAREPILTRVPTTDGSLWNLTPQEETRLLHFFDQELFFNSDIPTNATLATSSSRESSSARLVATMEDALAEVIARDLGTGRGSVPAPANSEDSEDADDNAGYITPPVELAEAEAVGMDIQVGGHSTTGLTRRTVEDLNRHLQMDFAELAGVSNPLVAVIPLTSRLLSVEQRQRLLQSSDSDTQTTGRASGGIPQDWLPVIAADGTFMSSNRNSSIPIGAQTRFSDAYVSGMPAKRRKLMQKRHEKIAQQRCEDMLQECIQSAAKEVGKKECANGNVPSTSGTVPSTDEMGPADTDLRDAFYDYVVEQLGARIHENSDFSEERFPNAARFLDLHQREGKPDPGN